MAYTKAQQQIIFRSAVALMEGHGDGVTDRAARERLEELYNPRTDTERQQIARMQFRARDSVELAREFRARPEYRPRATTYSQIPIAYAGEEGFEYRVIVRTTGQGADPTHRGLYIVTSATPISGREAMNRALEMARQSQSGDPYFDVIGRRAGGAGVEAFIIAAHQLTIR